MKTRLLFIILLAGLLPVSVLAEFPGIKLTVSGAEPATGSIEASVFSSEEDFLMEAFLQESGTVSEDGTFEAEFAGLEEGEYAIVIVHDANGNGIYDAGLFGFGGESVAYSNNASSWLGRPSFDDAKFTVTEPAQTIHIDLD